jgi:hypothetical protein
MLLLVSAAIQLAITSLYRRAFTFFIVQQILSPHSLIIQKYALSKSPSEICNCV